MLSSLRSSSGTAVKKRRGVVVLTNQMKVIPYNIGWTLLQGMPLTRENITYGVREIVGLGIALDTDEKSGAVRISAVFPKSPAGEAGLAAGLSSTDRIGRVVPMGARGRDE